MITITIVHDDNRKIVEFLVTGHADYKNKGDDIVCAAVSAVVQTAVEGLKRYLPEGIHLKKEKGILHLSITKGANIYESSIILETMLLGLKRIEENYQEYVRIVMP
ncbi:ribosomal-processing cysteine protease Prp [Candidatus Desantisbacteria bacterium]|nr:ribosomal-processing cysteine protease Prp [Candidatus Desantisbacteria bacterium]